MWAAVPGPCSLAPLRGTVPLEGQGLRGSRPLPVHMLMVFKPKTHLRAGGLHRAGLGLRGSPQVPSVRPSALACSGASQQQAQTEPWISPALAAEGAHPKLELCLRPNFTQMPNAGSGPAPPRPAQVLGAGPALTHPISPGSASLTAPSAASSSQATLQVSSALASVLCHSVCKTLQAPHLRACWGSHLSLQRGHRQGVPSAPTGKMSCSSVPGGQGH